MRERTDIRANRHRHARRELFAELLRMKSLHGPLALSRRRRFGMSSKIFSDGKRRYGIDLLFAHDAHGLGAKLVGVIDGGDSGMGRVEGSRLARAMDADARAHACRFLHSRCKFRLIILIGRSELAVGEMIAPGFINLDK